MSEPSHLETNSSVPIRPDIDIGAARDASVQLLSHLKRSGIQFLPSATVEGIAGFQAMFSESSPETRLDVDSGAPPSDGARATGIKLDDGVTDAIVVKERPPRSRPIERSRLQPVDAVTVSADSYSQPSLALPERIESLRVLQESVAQCTRCSSLASCRTQTVFGEGNPTARIVFFGEGPGADEDKSGRPFVGRAGQLLTKMIEACHLSREEVYILNTVKCRPPGNRNPEPDEIRNCREYFETQLQLIQPEYIVCLGAVSSQALLGSKLSIGRLRQRFHQYHDSKVLVIYHPAYLLRNPDAKKAAWADLQMLMKDAGL